MTLLSPIRSLFTRSPSSEDSYSSQYQKRDANTLQLLSFPSFSTGQPRLADCKNGTSVLLQKDYYHKTTSKSRKLKKEDNIKSSITSDSNSITLSQNNIPSSQSYSAAVAALCKCQNSSLSSSPNASNNNLMHSRSPSNSSTTFNQPSNSVSSTSTLTSMTAQQPSSSPPSSSRRLSANSEMSIQYQSKSSPKSSPLWRSSKTEKPDPNDDVCPVKQVMLPDPAIMATE